MTPAFWIKRFLSVAAVVFVVLFAVYLARGRPFRQALMEGAIWAVLTSGVFVSARLYHSRKGRQCALCRDTPGMRDGVYGASRPK